MLHVSAFLEALFASLRVEAVHKEQMLFETTEKSATGTRTQKATPQQFTARKRGDWQCSQNTKGENSSHCATGLLTKNQQECH